MEKLCSVCGSSNVEQHHCVFRSQARYMIKTPINHMYLCPGHHRGDEGPHKNRKVDIKYKMELQSKLFKLFSNESYTADEIKDLLGISNKDIKMMLKHLRGTNGRYDRVEIVRVAMGGIIYAD